MLRFMIKLPFRIIAAPVWLVLAAVNIVLVFLVGLSAGFCYLIAGISVVTEVLSIGFGISACIIILEYEVSRQAGEYAGRSD